MRNNEKCLQGSVYRKSISVHFNRAMLSIHGTSHGPVSICPSVCLSSQVRVLLKRLNVGSHKQHHTIPQDCSFFDAKDLREIRPASRPAGRQMRVEWVKIGDFWQITGYISKTVQDRRIVSIKVGKLAKFQLTRRIALSFGDSWASCFLHVNDGCGSVLLRRRSDTL